jgi:hypothetical protein
MISSQQLLKKVLYCSFPLHVDVAGIMMNG